MPPLSKHQSAKITKLLLVGDSGAGKTGALASLASAGYNLRILDLDNGLDVLSNLLTSPNSTYAKDSASRVHFITLTEKMKRVGSKFVPVTAKVWTKALDLLMEWKDEDVNFGSIYTWTAQDVLVIDSLSMLSNAAMCNVLAFNGRLQADKPFQGDWGVAQSLVESFCQALYDDNVKCNVIVNCHIKYLGDDDSIKVGYPNTLGKALPPIIGRYFNSTLMVRSVGQGSNLRRKILTKNSDNVSLKNTAPSNVLAEYPLETGLADYFKAVQSASSSTTPPTPQEKAK